jgi:hypothetical protein
MTMRNLCLSALLAAGLLFSLPVLAQDAKKQDNKKPPSVDDILGALNKKNDKKDVAGKDDAKDPKKPGAKDDKNGKDKKDLGLDDKKSKLEYGTVAVGSVQRVEANGELALKITTKIQVQHADAAQRMFNYNKSLADRANDLARRQFDIQRERNPQQRQNLIQQYYQQVASYANNPIKPPELYYAKDVTNDVIVRLGKDVIVRTLFPEPQYDDKGNPIQLTPQKIKEMRGPEGYPAFPAQLSDLRTGQTVQIYLARPKGAVNPKDKNKKTAIGDIIGKQQKPNPNPNPNNAKDGGNAPAVDELENPNIPEVVMIVIVKENSQ